jgi:hypothetical protein
MSSRILIVLAVALAACTVGQRSTNTRPMDPRTPYIFHGDGQDGTVDVVNGITAAAVIAAAQPDPETPLCTPESESGNPPHTCPSKAGGEQPGAAAR